MRLRRTEHALAIPAVLLAAALLAAGCGSSGGGGSSSSLVAVPANESYLTATSGTAYIQTFTFTGLGTSGTVSAPQGAPAGLTFTQQASADSLVGTLSGTPSMAGTGAFEVQVTGMNGRTQTFTYGFTVIDTAATLTLSPTSLPAAISHVLYNQALTVTGGTAPFTWTLQSGTLPPGLALSGSTSSSNAITGTPTTSGVYQFTLMVSDGSGPPKTGTFPLSLTVN